MTEKTIYRMPDGSEHEFENDEIATQAYKAWIKQFGEKKPESAPPKEAAPKQEPSTAAKIAANPLTRLALGASAPFRGAAEMFPGRIGDEWIARNKELERLIEEGNAAYPGYVKATGAISDFVGNALSPALLGLAKAMPAAKTVSPKSGASALETVKNIVTPNNLVTQGAILGGVGGATAPTGATGGERVGQTLVGAGLGGVLAPPIAKAAQAVGNVVGPIFSKKAADTNAAKMASKVAGDRAAQVASELQASGADDTAAQAAINAGSAEFSALEPLVATRRGSEFAKVSPTQEAARQAELSAVTPDLKAAQAARDAATAQLYAQAMRKSVKIDPTMEALFARMPPSVLKDAENIARTEGRSFDFGNNRMSGESLHYIKRALSDLAFGTDPSKGIGKDAQKAVRDLLDDYLIALEYRNPAYGKARTAYANASTPVNQATVLSEMSSILENPAVGERAVPFLNAMGRGEKALLKRSAGVPRYEHLWDVLDTGQMDTVSRIAAQLRRDAELARMSEFGQAGALEKLRAGELRDVRAPSLLDAKFTLLNRLLNHLEGTGGAKTETALAQMMLPKSSGGDLRKLGALMRAHLQKPQGRAEDVVKYVAPPLIQKASSPAQVFDED